jgi:hypothetical protein
VGWLANSAGLVDGGADELEQRVRQGIGVILVFVATGNLQEALAQEESERMTDRTAPPVADLGGKCAGQAQAVVGACEPDESPIRGQLSGVERDRSRE